ncbi:MAG TPA: DUF222 domain-containing protein [Marmoricola sp.]
MALRTDVAPLAQLAAREPLDAVVDVVTQVREVMAGLPGGDLTPAYGLVDGEALDGLVGEVAAAASQLDELKLRLARLAEASDRPGDVGAAGADAWLARLTGTTRACAAGGIWLARKLDQRYPAVREAFAAGALDEKRARIIVRAAETMPEAVTDAQRADAVESLVARAVRDRLNPTVLRRAARRMCDVVSRECADQHQAELLHADEVAADAETYLWLVDRGNGTFEGRFVVPELQGRILKTVLEHLSSPRRVSRNRAGESVVDATVPRWNYDEILGRAFTELLEHLPTDGLAQHGRVGATVMVHIDLEHLRDGLAAAGLDAGGEISAGQARRIACGAGIIPAVLGTAPVPLDLGRETRLHTKAQRAALSAVHTTCAAEGCERPFAWCEIHHHEPWSAGGTTDIDNAIPLCGWHHHRIHDPHYRHSVMASGEIRLRRRRPDIAA